MKGNVTVLKPVSEKSGMRLQQTILPPISKGPQKTPLGLPFPYYVLPPIESQQKTSQQHATQVCPTSVCLHIYLSVSE